jgi:transcriptional regulator with XRE-family HTH domain
MGQRIPLHNQQRIALCHVLKHARIAAGFKQIDVARRLGVTQSYVSKYESGSRRLDIFELLAVCEALGIELGNVLAQIYGEIARSANDET